MSLPCTTLASVPALASLLPAVLILAAACAPGDRAARSDTEAGAGVVTKVVDGDTIGVRLGSQEERVRLIGIDTPETHGRGGLRECFGAEAAARTAALLPSGTRVRLERDVEARDRYGRLLAYVYRASDGLFVNLALAREGFATTLTYPPNVAHVDDFVAAVRSAREAERGLWRRCGGPDRRLSAGAASAPRTLRS